MTDRYQLIEYEDNVWGVYDTTGKITDEKSSLLWIWKQLVVDTLNKYDKENKQLKKQLLENTCDNCIYSKSIYADVECKKKD